MRKKLQRFKKDDRKPQEERKEERKKSRSNKRKSVHRLSRETCGVHTPEDVGVYVPFENER